MKIFSLRWKHEGDDDNGYGGWQTLYNGMMTNDDVMFIIHPSGRRQGRPTPHHWDPIPPPQAAEKHGNYIINK